MTTDITELAQREKFEAWVMTQICISKSTLEGLRTTDGYRNSTLSGTDYNRLWSLYQSVTAELLEALEKAQADGNEYAVSERAAVVKSVELQDEIYGLKARIAELESRTVKMPEPFKLAKSSSGLTYYFADDVDAALTAAGIKWEAE